VRQVGAANPINDQKLTYLRHRSSLQKGGRERHFYPFEPVNLPLSRHCKNANGE
jgi:hypothetical protein